MLSDRDRYTLAQMADAIDDADPDFAALLSANPRDGLPARRVSHRDGRIAASPWSWVVLVALIPLSVTLIVLGFRGADATVIAAGAALVGLDMIGTALWWWARRRLRR